MNARPLVPLMLLLVAAADAVADDGKAKASVKCKKNFTLQGWSVIYKTAQGAGVIKCSNGQSTNVKLMTKGEVSLAWRGIGRGWDLGVALGKLTIAR